MATLRLSDTGPELTPGIERIVMVAPTPFFADRGCHVRILEEARALEGLGCRVTICTYPLGRDPAGLDVHRTIRLPGYAKLSAGPSLYKPLLDALLVGTVLRACFRTRPQLIHAHLHEGVLIAWVAALFYRVPVVADLQGSLTGELLQHKFMKRGGALARLFRWIERIINGLPDLILISSENLFGSSEGDQPGTLQVGRQLANRPQWISDGVDIDRFHPDTPCPGLREQLGIPPDRKLIGFVGLLTVYQGVPVLLETIPHVLRQCPDAHFLIMGYPDVEHYRARSRELGVAHAVTFTGRLPYEELPKYLALCSVAVAPKSGSSEGNGKLFNYMAMGLPVVAADIPLNRSVLGEFGCYVEATDPQAYAERILDLLVDEQRARQLGCGLRERVVHQFSWRGIGRRIVAAYHGACGARASGARPTETV